MNTQKELLFEQVFYINGMTCQGCVAKVTYLLQSDSRIQNVAIDLENGKTDLLTRLRVTEDEIKTLLSEAPKYSILSQPNLVGQIQDRKQPLAEKRFSTYWPLFLIVIFISGTALLVQFPYEQFSFMLWMQHFMGGFFIVFSFFKFLHLKGFSESYAMYDVLAKRWRNYGYIYPFLELGLGILYITYAYPLLAHWATVVLLGFSAIGVIDSNLKNKKIKCACLGDVFNLPMSTVTVVEDLLMVAMALTMILFHN
jgi:copper chaperone CopZ